MLRGGLCRFKSLMFRSNPNVLYRNPSEGGSLPADEVQSSQSVRPEEGILDLSGGPPGPGLVLRPPHLKDAQRLKGGKVC